MTHSLTDWLRETERQQTDLADELGISRAYLSQIIAGLRRPSPEVAARIDAVTGVDARTLLRIPLEAAE
jgi:transcriptional regulator with XRE-family HTH domain